MSDLDWGYSPHTVEEMDALRRDVARLLGLDDDVRAPALPELCRVHGPWVPAGLIDECPECLRDQAFVHEYDHLHGYSHRTRLGAD